MWHPTPKVLADYATDIKQPNYIAGTLLPAETLVKPPLLRQPPSAHPSFRTKVRNLSSSSLSDQVGLRM